MQLTLEQVEAGHHAGQYKDCFKVLVDFINAQSERINELEVKYEALKKKQEKIDF